ncbi:DUF924 family protein [Oceanisphaera psychrotolerans]|uniref:DUF924 domain-containing protein n=1 Tax=Oceanisphaera psychrotolerans TaxID=1414654 RepID=A0A1J4QFB5_9GAMM|nr:DUF924 family protein [Oceanisphaera psychrotolerans]OIN07988.1 hypothetical protein BFR47_15845 [Oceanisphaera psychrotolerans]
MYHSVLQFWFEELTPAQWWQKNAALDDDIRHRFGDLHRRACLGELFEWRTRAEGRLAEIIVLDQFSRNIHRDRPGAFAADGMALALAQEAISAGAEQGLTRQQRVFLYMPMMHSESLKVHEVALALFEQNGIADNLDFERRHRDIIARFGRYPHRNAILGRESTAEEIAFLQQPGSGF